MAYTYPYPVVVFGDQNAANIAGFLPEADPITFYYMAPQGWGSTLQTAYQSAFSNAWLVICLGANVPQTNNYFEYSSMRNVWHNNKVIWVLPPKTAFYQCNIQKLIAGQFNDWILDPPNVMESTVQVPYSTPIYKTILQPVQ